MKKFREKYNGNVVEAVEFDGTSACAIEIAKLTGWTFTQSTDKSAVFYNGQYSVPMKVGDVAVKYADLVNRSSYSCIYSGGGFLETFDPIEECGEVKSLQHTCKAVMFDGSKESAFEILKLMKVDIGDWAVEFPNGDVRIVH